MPNILHESVLVWGACGHKVVYNLIKLQYMIVEENIIFSSRTGDDDPTFQITSLVAYLLYEVRELPKCGVRPCVHTDLVVRLLTAPSKILQPVVTPSPREDPQHQRTHLTAVRKQSGCSQYTSCTLMWAGTATYRVMVASKGCSPLR